MTDPRITKDSLGMMTQPEYWPKWPILPIKNRRHPDTSGFPTLGVLIELGLSKENPDIRFVEGNMFMIDEQSIRDAPKADCKRLVADGWEVD